MGCKDNRGSQGLKEGNVIMLTKTYANCKQDSRQDVHHTGKFAAQGFVRRQCSSEYWHTRKVQATLLFQASFKLKSYCTQYQA